MIKKLYSCSEDCAHLAFQLYNVLNDKFEVIGSIWNRVVCGYYHVIPLSNYSSINDYNKDRVTFSYKFRNNEFLRISIGTDFNCNEGIKLAALSDFCEIITKLYGKPTFFYTLKDDKNHTLNMQWSFENAKEDIEAFQEEEVFDDASIDKLIIFNNELEINEKIGMPNEMMSLVEEHLEDFVNAKLGKPTLKRKVKKQTNGRVYKKKFGKME